MNIIPRVRVKSRSLFGILLGASILLIGACQPIVDPAELETREAEALAALIEVEPAKATIDASLARVREGPGDDYELAVGIEEGESYPVLAMTSDGAWIQLEIDSAPNGQGWVSTEFVTLEGDITNIQTVPAEESESAPAAASTARTNLEAIGEAVIETPLPLRVRSEPTDAVDNKIGSVYNLEKYPVLGISDDGQWILLDVPELSDSGGWVWWENVILQGDLADQLAAVPGAESEVSEAEVSEAEVSEAEVSEAEVSEAEVAESESAETEVAETGAAETEEVTGEAITEQITSTVIALIETPLPLRVRSEPTDAVDNKIGSVYNLETYPVLDISDDGQWILIDVPELSDSGGWIWWENVILQGDLADQLAAATPAEAAAEEPEPTATEAAETEADAETDAAGAPDAEGDSTGAQVPATVLALIDTPLPLRVRSAPTDAEDNKIGNVFDGETYPVLEISADGLWVKIAVPELSEDGGWISAEYVIVSEQ